MGLILDSDLMILAERSGDNANTALSKIEARFPGEKLALSVVTLIELAHGIARADSFERKRLRQGFLDEVQAAIPVYPVTVALALRAGAIDGSNAAKGLRVAFADLLIGVTALELGYRVATRNLNHFRMIPGLALVTL